MPSQAGGCGGPLQTSIGSVYLHSWSHPPPPSHCVGGTREGNPPAFVWRTLGLAPPGLRRDFPFPPLWCSSCTAAVLLLSPSCYGPGRHRGR